MINVNDLVGKCFNKLTVICKVDPKKSKPYYSCLCGCGNYTIVNGYQLLNGGTKSCGCLRKISNTITHGDSYSKEHRCWTGIKRRCLCPTASGYERYGGRGIKICERWRVSYEAFLSGMGRAPTVNHTIERIDNDKDYEPNNCKWSTKRDQNNNRRTSRLVLYKGKTQSVANWCRELNLHYPTIYRRINMKWLPEDAFESPLITVYEQHKYKKGRKVIIAR